MRRLNNLVQYISISHDMAILHCLTPLKSSVKSTISIGRDTNKVVMQIHLKCSGMTYNFYKEIFHFSYQESGSQIWNFEFPSLSEMQVPDQRVDIQTHRQVGIVTTTQTEVLLNWISKMHMKSHAQSWEIIRITGSKQKTTEDYKVQHLLSNL